MTTPRIDEGLDEVFDLVGDATRLAILRALWEERTAAAPDSDPAVSFSELREAAEIRDSGRFNYHLDKLRPAFVREVEGGYELTDAGANVIGAAVSGVYTDTHVELAETEMGSCPRADCPGTVSATYEAGTLRIDCDTCELCSRLSAPPILVAEHDLDTDPEAVGTFALTVVQRTIRGFCHVCSGPVERRLTEGPDPIGAEDQVTVTFECQACGSRSHVGALALLIDEPAVIAALHEAGVDYRYALLWQEGGEIDWEETLRAEGGVAVDIELPEEEGLRVLLDEDLEVESVTRR